MLIKGNLGAPVPGEPVGDQALEPPISSPDGITGAISHTPRRTRRQSIEYQRYRVHQSSLSACPGTRMPPCQPRLDQLPPVDAGRLASDSAYYSCGFSAGDRAAAQRGA